MKQLIIDDNTLKKLKDIIDIEDYLTVLAPYYPNLKITKYSIEEIEKALYIVFFKLIGKIIFISPLNMRRFLKDYLMKYEIMNIKEIILGLIIGMNTEEKLKNVNMLIEKYLENTEFINKLIEISTLQGIQLYMKPTKYNKAIREGLLYFKNKNEIFVLEAFLDQLYYITMIQREKIYNVKEREMISLFNRYKAEIYNINLIYRGITNNIDKQLLSQFIVNYFLFLDENKIDLLLNQNNLNDFFLTIDDLFRPIVELKYIGNLSNSEHPIWELERIFQEYYFRKFRMKMDDIEYQTIYKILELIIKKEKEIKREIIPNIVNIINKKFTILELK
ncbi:MAG: V-type ATPase subunit [Promethearchaeota archaeon]